jgi:histidine triad (HIT) family protein
VDNCIFCQIVDGKSPSYKLYEDNLFYGFLDIFPISKGHSLLVPKKHYRWTYEVPEFGEYFETARNLGFAIQKGLGAKWMQLFTHGQVPHAHIHITPRYEEDVSKSPPLPQTNGALKFTKEEFNKIADAIRKQLVLR